MHAGWDEGPSMIRRGRDRHAPLRDSPSSTGSSPRDPHHAPISLRVYGPQRTWREWVRGVCVCGVYLLSTLKWDRWCVSPCRITIPQPNHDAIAHTPCPGHPYGPPVPAPPPPLCHTLECRMSRGSGCAAHLQGKGGDEEEGVMGRGHDIPCCDPSHPAQPVPMQVP
jgi:hypothetical protein